MGPVTIYTHETALVKQRARELVIPYNSWPSHNQYCIIQVHCLSPKIILFPKELFHSLNLFSFLFSPRIREMPYGKQKSTLKIPSLLNCLSVADIFKSQFSEARIRMHPALQSSCSCLFSSSLLFYPQLEILYSKHKM